MPPGCLIIVLGWMLYNYLGITYALFLTPRAYWLAVAAGIPAASALTLAFLNAYFAYEGNFTRWGARPWKNFNAGSKWWCAGRHGAIFSASMFFSVALLSQALPHGLLLYTGASEVSELVVQSKRRLHSKLYRNCDNLVVAKSTEYRSNNLCLQSDQLYAALKVGDTLIVEGKANWIGLLVDRPIAMRDADTGLERSVHIAPRQHQQPTLVQLDDRRLTPKTEPFW